VPPKSKLGEAISYSLNQWSKLVRVIDDGRLSMDNNRAERSVRPFTVGRNNWLFSKTHNWSRASAVLYSLIETAKANDCEPYEYLEYVLREIPKLEEWGWPWSPSTLEHAKDGIVRPYRIPLRMTDTALVGGICVDIRKSMSRFVDAYRVTKENSYKR